MERAEGKSMIFLVRRDGRTVAVVHATCMAEAREKVHPRSQCFPQPCGYPLHSWRAPSAPTGRRRRVTAHG